MNVVIFGAGTVGSWIAKILAEKTPLSPARHAVTVIDTDVEQLRRLNEELDIQTITGSAAQASVLFQANIFSADLCLAVTGVDEVNIIGGSLGKAMGCQRAIARVYAPVFRDLSTFDYERHFGLDRLLSLEHLSAVEFAQHIRHPGSVAVENFAQGDVQVQEFIVEAKSKAVGKSVRELALPRGVLIGSIGRGEDVFIAQANHQLEVGDHITLIGDAEKIEDSYYRFQRKAPKKQGVVIAGGGETGYHLAKLLEGKYFSVLMMEADLEKCNDLAAKLKHTTVVHSDATLQKNLEEERVGSADVFVACTGDDENNIMACVEAKELGAKNIMAIVSRPDYANVLGKLGIDHAVSPRQVVAKQIVSYLTSGPVVYRRRLGGDGPQEGSGVTILELEVKPEVAATQHVLAKLDLPEGCILAAVTRNDLTRVPGADTRLQAGDTVVCLVADKQVDSAIQLFS
ncbi:Trk system potassium transport protein TrkA [Planctomycetales bacterium 10988]|nr:Trk system potassium transport protein TrkA [Planctomycetales bacterium 10988]